MLNITHYIAYYINKKLINIIRISDLLDHWKREVVKYKLLHNICDIM